MKPKIYNIRLLCLTLLLLIGAKSLHAQVDYLCFTADEAGYVRLSVTGSITADIQTSTDGINWTAYTFGTDINLATGNSVFFKGDYQGIDDANYAGFVMSGKVRASGNIMTLTDGDNPTLSLAGKNFCFNRLFYNCAALISVPVLPATTLAPSCYRSMFEGCTGITLYEAGTAPTWGIPAGAQPATDWNTDMLTGTGGTFTGNPEIGTDYYYTPLPASVGVTVNGIELNEAGSSGEGWTYVSPTLTLTNAGPFTISGTNTAGQVCVVVASNVTSTVTLSNLTLKVTDNDQCAFALEAGANVSLFLEGTNTLASGNRRAGIEVEAGRTLSITNAPGDNTAFLSVQGTYLGAGIGSGGSGNGGTITINGGTVEATGGSWAAGIGGGGYGDGGTITINGGTVTATGGYNGSGIGGGDENNGGTVIINGGVVTATGSDGGAGIGGGSSGNGGTVAISGGTIFAQGSDGGADMGPGCNGMVADANTFTGGSIRLVHGNASLQPSNGQDPVGCAKVTGFEPGARVEFTDHGNLPGYYGTNGIYADAGGVIYLWLPDGDYHFTANGRDCTTKIKNGTGQSGITVNGEEAAFGPDDPATAGWSYDAATRTVSLFGNGSFTLSGVNEIGAVCFTVPDNIANTVVLSNLTLRTTIADQCAFKLGQNANVSLILAGTNTLASGSGRAGIEVTTGQTLSITNAPGDETASLMVTGGDYGAGIGGDYGGTGGTVIIHGGTVLATGGDRSAGIGGGRGGNGGTVDIHGGTVTAAGGRWGTGIGGGDFGQGGTVTINGGTVFAQGDDYCAGIGGGDKSQGGTVTINGGTVTATSTGYGAGIGGGDEGNGGTVTINGGTVFAQGDTGGADIGPGRNSTDAGTNTFTGGSICLASAFIVPEPSNNTEQIYCAVVAGFAPEARVEFTDPGNLPVGFGTTDIFADDGGAIYLWLPNGTYTFTANGHNYTVTIQNGVGPTGVMVNGEEAAFGPAEPATAGWTYDAATGILSLTNAGPFTLSGTNTKGQVRVVVASNVTSTVTLSNLTLVTTNNNQCVFALETNAVVSLFLAGTNTLTSGYNRAGLEVAGGRTLSITNAPGDASGALTVNGGEMGAGIGGGSNGACGTVTINGGTVTANGSEFFGAGIGGGAGGGGGTVTISGGTVIAKGGMMGAGIGSGGYAGGNDGTVNISGGTVKATGGNWAAGIGGGDGDAGGTVNISGGTVTANGGQYGAGIGGGNNDDNPDGIAGSGGTVNITGGRVTATGGKCAAGIGGGTGQQLAGSAGAALSVSGGTVLAIGGAGGAPGVGGGLGNVEEGDTGNLPDISGTSTFTGGSIRIDGGYAAEDPTDGTNRVWCVTVPELTPNVPIVVTSLGTYGVNDLFADNDGKLYLWLPNDDYNFTAGTGNYEATVTDANTTATLLSPPAQNSYLTFSSANAFTITPSAQPWDGELFYSTDTTNWNAFTKEGATAANNGAGEFRLYFRGKNNTCIAGGNLANWIINADEATVACSGNIETLLDYTIVEAGNHPTMAANCFANLFRDCAALSSAPELAATNLSNNCYTGMFRGCTGLTVAPALPATTLIGGCYQEMFKGCTSLVQAPELKAMTLPPSCYKSMFMGCTALTTAPELPATTLGVTCYQYMFFGCTSLTKAPTLQAMTMTPGCYHSMFFGCTSLTSLPELPATTLAPFCYNEMFSGCTSLTSLPELPATTLAQSCYRFMFENCTSIMLNTEVSDKQWSIPNDAVPATDWNLNMLAGTGGSFTGDPVIGTTYYYSPRFTGSGDWNSAERWSTGTVPAATQKVIIDGDATISSDLETAGFVINASKSITVNAGKKLTINNKSFNNGTIHLLSDATDGTATLVGDVAGHADIQQTAVNYRTYYLSSPVNGTVTTSVNMGQSITFTESTNQWSTPAPFAGITPVAGKGYGVQVGANVAESERGKATTLSFAGTLNTGEVKIPITSGNRKFNFLGNPYPSYLNTIKVVANPNITKSLWFYSKLADNTPYQFTAYNIPTGLSIPDEGHDYGYIPPMQGFWVKANEGVNTDYTFSNEMRVHKPAGSPAIFRAPQAAERKLMRLQLSNGTIKDETAVLFSEEATNDWNTPKMTSQKLCIYTLKDGENLALNSSKAINYDVEIPVGVKATSGQYTFSASKFENLGTNKVFLIDKAAHVTTDLSSGNIHTVNFKEAYEGTDRFALLFPRSGVITGWDGTAQTEFYAYAKDKRITVSSDAQSGTIYVYNSVGQQVAAEPISSNLTTVSAVLQEGVYVVKLNNQTVKVVVR